LSVYERRESLLRGAEPQLNYLRNPLPPGDGICRVCRSVAGSGYAICYPCSQHRAASGGQLIDVVVPIAYSIKGTQHAHNLIIYKADRPSNQARYYIASLGAIFFVDHWACLTGAAGGSFTHVATVPSTKGRTGPHPLELILSRRTRLPAVAATPNLSYSSDDRDFHADRFTVDQPVPAARVLLLDDTWTTGARIQSLAHALKTAGAAAVVAVVLGRHVNPSYGAAKPLLDRLRSVSGFALDHCAVEDLHGPDLFTAP
jgi:hypothetical protein